MSTDHDVPQADQTPSRRTSRNSNPEPQQEHETLLTTEKLLSKSERLRDSPEEVQHWLEGLDPKAFDSKVPQQLLELDGTAAYNGRSYTFIEVLADWILSWRELFIAPRKKSEKVYEKTTPPRLSNESKILVWLLEFVNDYLRLSGDRQSASDVEAITTAAVQLCSKTPYHCDIATAIPVLSTIAQKYDYPNQLTHGTMIVLATSLIHVPEATDDIYACLQSLVEQRLGISELFRFARIPTKSNEAEGLVCARGALRLLRRAINTTNPHGDYVVNLDDFIDTLLQASTQELHRYSPDILNACHTIISSDRQPALNKSNVERIMDIATRCYAASPEVSDASSAALSITHSSRSETNRTLERYRAELQTSSSSFGQSLYSLTQIRPEFQMVSMIDFILQHPVYSPVEHVFECLEDSTAQHLFMPPTLRWHDRCAWLLRKFVSDEALSAECRLYAIKIIHELLSSFKNEWSNDPVLYFEGSSPLEWLCSALEKAALLVTPAEEDVRVMEALYGLLSDLTARLPDSEGGQQLAVRIISTLHNFIKSYTPQTPSRKLSAVHATEALVQTLGKNFHVHPSRTESAFMALISVVGVECKVSECRLEAMKALFRIRSTHDGSLYLSRTHDCAYIARALCRTRNSAIEFDYELPGAQRRSASSTSLSSKSSSYENLWMYDDEEATHIDTRDPFRQIDVSEPSTVQPLQRVKLKMGEWLVQVISCLQSDTNWETYSLCLVYAGSQLGNVSLFSSFLLEIATLRRIVCEQVVRGALREPPAATGLKKSDVALCLYNILTPLIAYATMTGDVIQKEYGDDLVRAFLHGVGGRNFEGTDRGCIHALSVCALEIPRSVASQYPNILERLSTSITKSYLTLHILEFLSQVANLPEVHSNFLEEEIRQIFAMCILFLEKTREQHLTSQASLPTRTATPLRHSGVSVKRPPYRAEMMRDTGEPKYAAALAYHTIICWFLSLKLERRKGFVSWLVPRLTFKNSAGKEMIDEQSEVLIDMMQRTAFSDLGETAPDPSFAKPADGDIKSASWLVGYSIITAETAGRTGLTQITKRQACGTTYSRYQQSTTPLPPHHAPSQTAMHIGGAGPIEILPQHVLLQMITTAAPTSLRDQPIALPEENFVARALREFNRKESVDSYKAGVLFISPGKTQESDFLATLAGSPDYDRFLQGLGYEVSLQPPLRFDPHGLQFPRDGKSTIAWRDRVTEIVFMIPTMMPPDDSQDIEWTTKKMHVGNCHVNIIFNRSGEVWSFDKLRTQFSSVNIIVTPADLNEDQQSANKQMMPDFYRIDVWTKDEFPNISPAADPKIVSAEQLPKFVRLLAINANVFSEVWRTKDHDTEFPSKWRVRLQAIKQLKNQVNTHFAKEAEKKKQQQQEDKAKKELHARGNRQEAATEEGRRTPVPQEDGSNTESGEESLAKQLDFGVWTS